MEYSFPFGKDLVDISFALQEYAEQVLVWFYHRTNL